jgi:ELWxxDGT repeat protein
MKKGILLAAAFAALAPLAIVAGSAQAATSYVPQHVYTFNAENNFDYAINEMASFGDKVVMKLNNGELWISDGTESGTHSLGAALDAAGVTDSGIQRNNDEPQSVDIDGDLYFFGFNGSTNEIYKTDGTTVTRVTFGLNAWEAMYYIDGYIYTHAGNGFFQVNPTNGALVDAGVSFDCTDDNYATQVQLVGGKILFVGDDNNCYEELWAWDPSSPSTPAVAINPSLNGLGNDATDIDYLDDTNNSFTMFEGEMYFAADGNDGTNSIGTELFKTDGTQAGTVLVKDLFLGIGDSSWAPSDYYMNPTIFNGELYFTDEDGIMYKTDGTTAGTAVTFEKTALQSPGDYTESPAIVLGGKMITDFYSPSTGTALYATDGTLAGTDLLIDPNPIADNNGISNGDQNRPVLFDGHVFFFGYDNVSNNVWVTDGTAAGSVQVSTFESDYPVGDSSERALVPAGDNLFFAVEDDSADGGTGEMALYKISAGEVLATTGVALNANSLGGLVGMALIALAGAAVIARRRITTA